MTRRALDQVDYSAAKWSGMPDRIYAKPHIRKREGKWYVDAGYLGFVPITFGFDSGGRSGSWKDMHDSPLWRKQ